MFYKQGSDTETWTDQDAQRDESSGAESRAMRIRPDDLKEFYAVDTYRSMRPLVETWLLIAATVAVALWSHSVIVWILAAIVIGRSQHALAVMMHEAAHFRLLEDRWWNDFVGQWLCAFPVNSDVYRYRKVHLRHHKYLLTDRDPDLSLSRGYPVSWESFRRKLTRDITGLSAMVMRGYVVVDANGRNRPTMQYVKMRMVRQRIPRMALGFAIIAMLFYLGLGWAYIALWMIPLLTVNQVILRVRGVLEHAGVPDAKDGLRNARTIISHNPIIKFLIGPYHVAYHLEHHLFPAVPHYNLPRLHEALKADPRFARALVENSYMEGMHDVIKPQRAAAPMAA
ncbi:MAG TPA: fatty acid desaturase family protein [Candidatus Binataceae bacterium]|nr:fatty acid desaturase family protein [Candidatus Binataceae bacterium]